jgi:hypothetical protein
MRIRSGEHSVRFERAGYLTMERRLVVAAGTLGRARCALTIDPNLPPEQRAELGVVVSEPGSRVLVDGRPLQKAPLPVGAHHLEVTKTGFEPYRRTVDARAGGKTAVYVVLHPTGERLRADRARERKTWGYVTGGAGVVLVAFAITLQVVNQNNYEEWQREQLVFSRELADGQSSPGHAKRAAELQEQATDIQRADDIALGAGVLGGVLLVVSGGLLFLGDGSEDAGATRSTATAPVRFSW